MTLLISCFLAACGGGSEVSDEAFSGLGENIEPTVSEVTISGNGKTGETLTLKSKFEDSDGDAEGNSIISWTTPTVELLRGTNKTFVIPNGFEGKTIYAWIYPVDVRGAEGEAVRSSNGIVIQDSNTQPVPITNDVGNTEPTVSEVTISGNGNIGETLILKSKFDDSDGDSEGNSIISWTTSAVELQRGSRKTYKVSEGLEGETIYAWIHPVDERGTEGDAVLAENSIVVQREDDNDIATPAPPVTPVPPNDSSDSSTTPYEDLLAHRSGFGKGVTGGAGGEVVVISNLNDDSLANALRSPDPKWIRFSPGLTGTWRYPSGKVHINSNKTIDGRGANITFSYTHGGLTNSVTKDLDFLGKTNLIIHNITFSDIGLIARDVDGSQPPGTKILTGSSPGEPNFWGGKGVSLWVGNYSTKVWIDHCTHTRVWDDPIAITNSTEVTISYNKFVDQHKGGVITGSNSTVTYHHNWFDGDTVVSWGLQHGSGANGGNGEQLRAFNASDGKVHSYNNFVNAWILGPMAVKHNAQAVIENNVFGFANGTKPPIRSKNGYVCQHGNSLEDTSVSMTGIWPGTRSESQAFDCSKVFTVQYQYALDIANNALKQKIQSQAGRSDNPRW